MALLCLFSFARTNAQLSCARSYINVSTDPLSCNATPTGSCNGNALATEFKAKIRVYFTVPIGIGTASPAITDVMDGGVSIFGSYQFCISGDQGSAITRSYIDYCVYGTPGAAVLSGPLDFTFNSTGTPLVCALTNSLPPPTAIVCLTDLSNCTACDTHANLTGKVRVFFAGPLPAGTANPVINSISNLNAVLTDFQLCASTAAATNVERSYIDYCVFANAPLLTLPVLTTPELDINLGPVGIVNTDVLLLPVTCPNAYTFIDNAPACSPCDGAFPVLHSRIRLFYPDGIPAGAPNPQITGVVSGITSLNDFKFCVLAGTGINSVRTFVDYCIYANAPGLILPGGNLGFTIKTSECAVPLDCIVGPTPSLYCIDNNNISFTAITTGTGGAGGVAAGCTDQTTCMGSIVYYAGTMTVSLSPCLPAGIAAPTITSFTRTDINGSVIRYCVQETGASAAAIGTVRCSVSYCVTSSLNNDTYLNTNPTLVLDASYEVTVNLNSETLTQNDCTAANIILPVKFGGFTAKRNIENVELKWETLTEIDNTGFVIERKTSGEWSSLGFMKTKAPGGNSSGRLNYSFSDWNDFNGVSQYRLQQIDIDGKASYSAIRTVKGMIRKISVFPNPSRNGTITIVTGMEGSTGDVIIRDVLGKTLRTFTGIQTGLLTMKGLAAGFYTVQVTDHLGGESLFAKFIVAKQ